jgi:hypothetical protein
VSAKITAAPASWGLLPLDAVSLASDVADYVTAYNLAADPATKTKATVEQKLTAKDILVAHLRSIGRRIQANPSITNSQRAELGLTVKDPPSPIPAPSTRPVTSIVAVLERTVKARLVDETTPTSRAKPHGVSEAEVFSHVGATAPADLADWTYQGQASRTSFAVTFPASVASGSKIWICARWCNHRGAPGPTGNPVATFIVGSVAEAA